MWFYKVILTPHLSPINLTKQKIHHFKSPINFTKSWSMQDTRIGNANGSHHWRFLLLVFNIFKKNTYLYYSLEFKFIYIISVWKIIYLLTENSANHFLHMVNYDSITLLIKLFILKRKKFKYAFKFWEKTYICYL